MIKQFTIYGERCSGTNYLEELMIMNFDIKLIWNYRYKHFFGNNEFTKNKEEDETLFIGIVRNPIDWIYSFYNNPHHVPKELNSMPEFLENEFYSIDMENNFIHYDLKKTYKNIFELRKLKNDYLMNNMPNLVKNYILLRYEDISENPIHFLNILKDRFNLTCKNDLFQRINYYKKEKNKKFIKKSYPLFSKEIHEKIINGFDEEQERKLNYFL